MIFISEIPARGVSDFLYAFVCFCMLLYAVENAELKKLSSVPGMPRAMIDVISEANMALEPSARHD